jgi:hypothetical protein
MPSSVGEVRTIGEKIRRRVRMVAGMAVGGVLFLAAPAQAQERYMGASYLSPSAEFSTAFQNFDAESDGWKVFLGYDANKHFGFEVSYYDLGDFDQTVGASSIHAEIEVFDATFRGILPIGERFNLFARLGYSSVGIEYTASSGILTVGFDDSDWVLLYGAGMTLKLGKRFGLRAEYEAWDTRDSLEVWSAGVVFRFGGRQ